MEMEQEAFGQWCRKMFGEGCEVQPNGDVIIYREWEEARPEILSALVAVLHSRGHLRRSEVRWLRDKHLREDVELLAAAFDCLAFHAHLIADEQKAKESAAKTHGLLRSTLNTPEAD